MKEGLKRHCIQEVKSIVPSTKITIYAGESELCAKSEVMRNGCNAGVHNATQRGKKEH